jgi:hypothetical protein
MAELMAADSRKPGNDSSTLRAALGTLVGAWQRERALFWTGLFCLLLGQAGVLAAGALGRFIAPEGDLAKPIAFSVALGIYVLTLAPLVDLARFSPRFHRRWCRLQVALTLGSVTVANLQTYRGIDPRFPQSGVPFDLLASVLFGLLALGGFLLFLLFAVSLFRRATDAAPTRPGLLVLGARYGAVAALVGYASGLWMIVVRGSRFGEAGDILPLHALGFHGLQTVPVVALLLGWGESPLPAARRWVHGAGSAWLGACAALAWQTLRGRSFPEESVARGLTLLGLLAWGLVVARAVHAWRRGAGRWPAKRWAP